MNDEWKGLFQNPRWPAMSKQSLGLMMAAVLISLIIIPGMASAEHEWDHRYVISGVVSDGNGDKAAGVAVEILCGEGETDSELCGLNTERNSETTLNGKYELTLHVHSSDHGKIIVLGVLDEAFNHTIDLLGDDGLAEESDRYVTMNITLSVEVSKLGYFTPFLIAGGMVLVLILLIMKKKNKGVFSPQTAQKGAKNEDNLTSCPKCSSKLRADNLIKHLQKQHYMSKEEAEDLASQ